VEHNERSLLATRNIGQHRSTIDIMTSYSVEASRLHTSGASKSRSTQAGYNPSASSAAMYTFSTEQHEAMTGLHHTTRPESQHGGVSATLTTSNERGRRGRGGRRISGGQRGGRVDGSRRWRGRSGVRNDAAGDLETVMKYV
jgi:hypothetical protein